MEGIEDGLETLSANEGIDIPDGIVDIVPYAAAIVGGARLIYGVLKTEREFKPKSTEGMTMQQRNGR